MLKNVQYITDTDGVRLAVILPLADYGELLEVLDIIPGPESRSHKPARPASEVIAELVANGKIQSGDERTYRFDLPVEVESFNRRHKKLLPLLPRFSETIHDVTNRSVPSNRQGLTIFMLCRLCIKDFSEILLLSSNAHGFAALQILRSMFEKFVDASYLHAHPDEIDSFWDYYFVQLKKLGWAKIAEKYDKDWQQKVSVFQTKTEKGKQRTQPRWSKHDLVGMAKEVGAEDLLRGCYYLPNLFVHDSPVEILFSLQTEADGTLTPIDRCGPEERTFADVAFFHGYLIVLKALILLMEHYDWKENELLVRQCADELESRIRSLHEQEE